MTWHRPRGNGSPASNKPTNFDESDEDEMDVANSSAQLPQELMPKPEVGSYNWQASMISIRERVGAMFNNDMMADVYFLVGKDKDTCRVPAHKFVLSIGSHVFDAMFHGGMAERTGEIQLPDVDPEAFLTLLQFLYSDEVEIEPERVMTTLYVAKKYAVPALETRCVDYLQKNLCSENAFLLLTQARLFDEPLLASLCLETIDRHTSEAMAAESFIDIDRQTLCSVLERDTLGIKESKLFMHVCQWAEAKCQISNRELTTANRRSELGDALQLIRFPLMTAEEFANGAAQSDILSDTEIKQLFLHFIANPKPHVTLPFSGTPRCCMNGKELVAHRFNSMETRWGYSGTTDKVKFWVNRRIFIVGFGLYGSIGIPAQYNVTIQLMNCDSGLVLGQNQVNYTTDGSKSTSRLLFKEPVEIRPNVCYFACATINGPDTYYGTKGNKRVYIDLPNSSKVLFQFGYAAGNNNGTSVEDGQIPEIIFFV